MKYAVLDLLGTGEWTVVAVPASWEPEDGTRCRGTNENYWLAYAVMLRVINLDF
jgi:hypothetical protein